MHRVNRCVILYTYMYAIPPRFYQYRQKCKILTFKTCDTLCYGKIRCYVHLHGIIKICNLK